MANLGFSFNAADVPPSEFDALPAGEYPCMIVDSAMKETKNRNGKYLELTHQIIDGHYKGKKFWARLNIDNPNETAKKIAQQQLAEIVKAVGHIGILQDSQLLHNKPLIARVSFVPAGGNNKYDSNEVKAWKQYGSAPAVNQSAFPAQAPQQPQQFAQPQPQQGFAPQGTQSPPWGAR